MLLGLRAGESGDRAVWSKASSAQRGVDSCACESPIMKWANTLSLQKEFTEAECSLSQQCQLVR